MAFKIIIFDLDGTLVDAFNPVARSINYTLKRYALPAVSAETIKRTVGLGDRHLLQTFTGPELIDEALPVYRRHHREALKTGTKLLPGAQKLLQYLKQNGYKTAVASNRPTEFSNIIIRHLGIKAYFDYVLCGDRVLRAKPYPDILKKILLKFALHPSEGLFVGDMTIDVETGRRAAVKTVAVVTGSSHLEELAALKPYAVVHRVLDLIPILEEG